MVLGAVVVLAGGYLFFTRSQGPSNPYRVSPVEVRSIRQTVEAFGSLDVVSRRYVPAPRPGQLSEVYVRRGAMVEEGQPLAKLDASFATGSGSISPRRKAPKMAWMPIHSAASAERSSATSTQTASRCFGRPPVFWPR